MSSVADAGPERCPYCGYDLHGLAVPHDCPECGRRYDEHTRVWQSRRQWIYSLAPVLLCLPIAVFLNFYLNRTIYPRGLRAVAVILVSWAVPLPIAIVWMRSLIRRGVLIAITPDGLLTRTAFARLVPWSALIDIHVVLRRNVYLRARGHSSSNISHFFESPAAVEEFRAAVADARRRAEREVNLNCYAQQTGKVEESA